MAHVLLIRHAENDFTQAGKLAGWKAGVRLNKAGQEQAALLAEDLARAPIKAVYSSPLARALQTARPIAVVRQLHVRRCARLGEVRYGDWQGKSLKALRRLKLWRLIQQRPSAVTFPGGESIRSVQVRAVAAIEDLVVRHPKDCIAVVSHGDVIKMIVACYLGMPLDLYQRIIISTASVSELWFFSGEVRVLRVNQTITGPGEK
jgi:probable phosphoglycerate mutase